MFFEGLRIAIGESEKPLVEVFPKMIFLHIIHNNKLSDLEVSVNDHYLILNKKFPGNLFLLNFMENYFFQLKEIVFQEIDFVSVLIETKSIS